VDYTLLEAAGRLTVLDGWHYGQTPDGTGMLGAYGRMICVLASSNLY
jgi:hypothetical protein